jgi:hypothetical protein
LIVASVPADEYGEAALARGLQDIDWVGRGAMAHEAVVEWFLPARAVVPMQLFTLFTSDDRAVQHVEHQRKDIQALLRRIEGRLEWGVRLTFDAQAVRDALESAGGARRGQGTRRVVGTGAPGQHSGRAYLARKRDLLDVGRARVQDAKAAAEGLFAALTHEADEARRRTATEQAAPGSRLLLDAAFLVPSARTRTFRAAVSRRAKALATPGVVVSLTGPWPAYNFIAPVSPEVRAKPGARDRGRRRVRGQAAR